MPRTVDTPSCVIGMSNRSVGGVDYAYNPGPPVSGQMGSAVGYGPNNVGKLVTVWGRVTSSSPGVFTIDDGTLPGGLIVNCRVQVLRPGVGTFVRVTVIAAPHGVDIYGNGGVQQIGE